MSSSKKRQPPKQPAPKKGVPALSAKDIEILDSVPTWRQALAKRKKLLADGKEVVIYRRTKGPNVIPDNYRLWRQRYLDLTGDEYGWEQGWNDEDNDPDGYKLF